MNLLPGVDNVRHVSLQFMEGCCLHAKRPTTLCSSTQDMIIGCKPLRRYKAIVDYGKDSICFKFGFKQNLCCEAIIKGSASHVLQEPL